MAILTEATRAKVKFEGRHYRNDELGRWIAKTFKTAEEQKAAWMTIGFIREAWPEAGLILRGRLIGIDEGEM